MEAPMPPTIPARKPSGMAGRIAATTILAVSALPMAAVCWASVWIVPKFEAIFDDFGAVLPAPTCFVIAVSDLSRNYWPVAAALVLLLYGGLALFIWRVDWRSGLAASILLLLLSIIYWHVAVAALFAPLAQIITDVRGSPGP